MRYYQKRPSPPRLQIQAIQTAFRRHDDGREVCLANPEGRAEYVRRKQLRWQEQRGICALSTCGGRMSLDECRFTGGNWEPTGRLRDDRIGVDKNGKPINELVHKDCLRTWHEQYSSQADEGFHADVGGDSDIAAVSSFY